MGRRLPPPLGDEPDRVPGLTPTDETISGVWVDPLYEAKVEYWVREILVVVVALVALVGSWVVL